MRRQFGAKPRKEDLEKYTRSNNWQVNKFQNLEDTSMNINIQDLPKLLYKQFCQKQGREPEKPIPIEPFDKADFLKESSDSKLIWYGHSVLLLRLNSKTILIDPMFGQDAAPISPFGIKRFSNDTLNIIDDLPEIDLALISHDHYDHLDLNSIQKLIPKVRKFGMALGVARHLKKWGVPENKMVELDWWEDLNFNDIKITFTPTRHFSGRGLMDRSRSLWGGWVLRTPKENIWFSGDSGYGNHFKEIGERLGPFDFGIMECGQYNEKWHQIHMYPEESIQAALDVGLKKIMAVHWAGFALAQHHWKDPIRRFISAAAGTSLKLSHPKPGEIFTVKQLKDHSWWEAFK
ncbi:MBL fold metallo-hydrolase [Gramella lutea]|uniref:MBL fold metallo-hydrolase n=1 Tax=Christiangramia lutea TaxID=1607951 RepID=A0A9X2AAE8_9FLAO|nr:MBL fold metallo-hydrolase [Christiangramia lutea]MCH4823106.1 MBL fold metallo-hydrolase [Christiangramia lutea]